MNSNLKLHKLYLRSSKRHQQIFFYGWFLLIIVVITNLMSAPGQTSGFAPFVEHIIVATGFSRQTLANLYMAATLTSALILIPAGPWVDAIGSRRVVVGASIAMALILVMMSFVGRFGMQSVMAMMLLLGLVGMRFTGQGLMMVAGHATIARWFVKRRGLAVGVISFVGSLMSPLSPLLLDYLIFVSSWREAWLIAAVVIGLGNSVIVWFFWKDTPEQCGLLPDGSDAAAGKRYEEEVSWTRKQAIKIPLFWVVIGCGFMTAMLVTAVSFHIVHLGAQRGLSSAEALRFFVPMVWVSMSVGLVCNILADRMTYQVFLPLQLTFLAAAICTLTMTDYFMWSAVMFGLTLAMAGPVGVSTLPRWFGREHLGAIGSVNWTGVVVGSAIGPSLFSLAESDAYRVLTWVYVVIIGILVLGSLCLKAPKT